MAIHSPVFADLVEDRVRSRCVAALVALFLFILVAFGILMEFPTNSEAVAAVKFTSAPPVAVFVGYPLVRAPRVQVITDASRAVTGQETSISIDKVTMVATRNTLDCSTSELGRLQGTLEGMRIQQVCTPVWTNTVNTTTSVGLASFFGLTMISGPAGKYTMSFNAGDYKASKQVFVFTNVYQVYNNGIYPPAAYTINEAIPDANKPVFTVTNRRGLPVANRIVTAFAGKGPFFFNKDLEVQSSMIGQQFAILSGATSKPSTSAGQVTWDDLRIVASSRFVSFLYFYCEGSLFSWSSPEDRPASFNIPKVPEFHPGIQIETTIQSVSITTQPSTTVVEGVPLATQPELTLSPAVAGRKCFALVESVAGFWLSKGYVPQTQWVATKSLINAVSADSDSDGRVKFENLGFQVAGAAGAFNIKFSCDGIPSATANAITVTTSVASVVVQVVPVRVPSLVGNYNYDSDTELMASASIRVLNAAGQPVPGKTPQPILLDNNGKLINDTVGQVSVNFQSPGGIVSGTDGYVSVPVVANFLSNSSYLEQLGLDAHSMRLKFTVDGVQSAPSNKLSIAPPPADILFGAGGARRPVFLRTVTPPPAAVETGEVFSFTVMAVDYEGMPVPGTEVYPYMLSELFPSMYPFVPLMFGLVDASKVTADANGLVTFSNMRFKRAPPKGTVILVPVSGANPDFYGDRFPIRVTNKVGEVLVFNTPNTRVQNVVPLDANRAAVLTLKVKDQSGAAMAGLVPTIKFAGVPSSEWLINYDGGAFTTAVSGGIATLSYGAFSKYITVKYSAAGSAANGELNVQIQVAAGAPGFYAAVFDVAGVVSTVGMFWYMSPVAKLKLVQQPVATPNGGNVLQNGDFLAESPVIQILDKDDNPLEGYRLNAAYVNDMVYTNAFETNPGIALAPALTDLTNDNVHNLLGYRMSDPSNATGHAVFPDLGIVDALSGCYHLVFYHLSALPDFNTIIIDTPTDPICVNNVDEFKITEQPTKITSNGSPFSLKTQMSRPYQSELDKDNTFVSFVLVDSYLNAFRSPDASLLSALSNGNFVSGSWNLSPLYLSGTVCVVYKGNVQFGDCQVTKSSSTDAFDQTVYTATTTFNSVTWDNALPGDQLTLRAFGGLVMRAQIEYNLRRQSRVVGACDGPASDGAFGMCCDSTSQCGEGLKCSTTTRTCTLTCSSDEQCPAAPSLNRGPKTGFDPAVGYCTAGECDASSLVGWSYAPYCQTCKLPKYSGDAGPNSLTTSVFTLLTSAIGQIEVACNAFQILDKCNQLDAEFDLVVNNIIQTCTSPAAQAVCTGGFTTQAIQRAMLDVIAAKFGPRPSQSTSAQLAQAFTNTLFSSEPARLPGRSAPSSRIKMQDTPGVVSIRVQPPKTIVVGQIFEVDVFVGVASGLPVTDTAVSASLTDITTSNLLESVEGFIKRVSGEAEPEDKKWTKAALDSERSTAQTDSTGLARFRMRIKAAKPGKYALSFKSAGATSSKSQVFSVVNNVNTVAIVEDMPGSRAFVDFPATVNIQQLRVKLTSAEGFPVLGKNISVHVKSYVEQQDLINATENIVSNFATMTAYQRFSTILQLLVQGGRQLNVLPQPSPSAVVTSNTPSGESSGEYNWEGTKAKIKFNKAGKYQLVFVSDGIASSPGAVFEIEQVDTKSFEYKLMIAGIKALLFLLGGFMWIGNSQWHSRWLLFLSLALTMAMVGVAPFITEGNKPQLIAMEICLGMLIIAYIATVIVEFRSGEKDSKHFYAQKSRAFFKYTKRKLGYSGTSSGSGSGRGGGEGVELMPRKGSASDPGRSKAKGSAGDTIHENPLRVEVESKAAPIDYNTRFRGMPPATIAAEVLARKRQAQLRADKRDVEIRAAKTNFRAIKAALRLPREDSPDAFFFPTRVLAALLVSLAANAVIGLTSIAIFLRIRNAVENLDAQTLRTVFTAISSIEELFQSLTQSTLFTHEVAWGYEQAEMVHNEFVTAANAIFAAFVTGVIVGLVAYIVSWAILMLDLRGQIIAARYGRFNFNKDKVFLADASNYFGIQISNAMITYCLVVLAVTGACTPIYWPLIRDVLISLWPILISLLIPVVINLIFKKGFGYCITTNKKPYDHIKHRRWYHWYDLIQLFLQLYTGIMTAIVRFIMVVVIGLVSIPRLDRSPMPAWLERYLLLDNGSKSYQGVILQQHTFNNPVGHCAAWAFNELVKDAAARRKMHGTADSPDARGRTRAGLIRMRARFSLWLTLHNNPAIRHFRVRQSKRKEGSTARPKARPTRRPSRTKTGGRKF